MCGLEVDFWHWLKIICFECGNVLTVHEKNLPQVSFNDLVKKIGNKNTDDDVVCIHCKGRHPHIIKSKVDDISINVEFFKSKKYPFNKSSLNQFYSIVSKKQYAK